jgi:hypothetical protein
VRVLRYKGPWFAISAISGKGCDALCNAAYRFLSSIAKPARARRAA